MRVASFTGGMRVQAVFDQLTDVGNIAVIVGEFAFVGLVWLAMLWKPRHRTHRTPHDCRAYACPWLDERPKRAHA
jgi:hypothetical protein